MRVPLVMLLVFAVGASARATTLIPTDVPEMSREAFTIALGRVAAVEARWVDGRRRLETLVTLDAEDYFKGALGPRVQFVVPGGEIGRFRSVMVGAPTLKVGQRVIVFLGGRGPSLPHILGLNQGLFRVTSENGRSIVQPPAGLMMPGSPVDRATLPRTMRLEDFAGQVRALAGTLR
jgi:hypothetical protein